MPSSTPESHFPPVRRLLAVGAAVIVVALVALPFYAMNGHPVRISSLSKITTSSTQMDVRALLGKPSHVDSWGGTVSWRYDGFTWCMVTVVFGPDGKVTSIDHDH
ncbi:MAG: hypothetical protein U0941_21095 [Planctomycetaceae bacterium]